MAKKTTKPPAQKRAEYILWADDNWKIVSGRLVPRQGRPSKVKPLFSHVAEKIPFDALAAVKSEFHENGWHCDGVYIAHDSMGVPRYVGRGQVFSRLATRLRAQPHELCYFSFYIVSDKKHEREIENLVIKLCGSFLQFNDRKKREGIAIGSVRDFEAGTRFIERRRVRKKKSKRTRE